MIRKIGKIVVLLVAGYFILVYSAVWLTKDNPGASYINGVIAGIKNCDPILKEYEQICYGLMCEKELFNEGHLKPYEKVHLFQNTYGHKYLGEDTDGLPDRAGKSEHYFEKIDSDNDYVYLCSMNYEEIEKIEIILKKDL